jgi:hypothetical protein
VVEGPQQKYGIDSRVRQPQSAGVAHLGTGEGLSRQDPCLFDVERDRIDQVDLISPFGQPDGVSPWTAAYVSHDGGWGWEVPFEKHLRPHELERARSAIKSVAFEPPSVVRRDSVIA